MLPDPGYLMYQYFTHPRQN